MDLVILFEETIPKLGVDVRFVDIADGAAVEAAINDDTSFVFAEIISNPKLVVPDISQLKALTQAKTNSFGVDATITGICWF